MRKKLLIILLLAVFLLGGTVFLLAQKPKDFSEEIEWGVTFSKYFTEKSDLDWRGVYLAILDDLGVKKMRLVIYWPEVVPKEGEYDFSSYDWMVKEAEKRGVELVLVVGRKVPRWPECHIPGWVESLEEDAQKEQVLALLKETVGRYKNSSSLRIWQIENEPFLAFGECEDFGADFLDQEIELVRGLDSEHPIMVTDSGELSVWLGAYKRADIFGTTVYRIVWDKRVGYFKYPLPPRFFWLKANLARLFYPFKPIVVSELQGEYWGPKQPYETPVEIEMEEYGFGEFQESIEYARQVGFGEVYLWGVEWWYWLREKHGDARFWEEAKKVIGENR